MGSLPRGAERMIIKIGSQTFMRFEDVLTWSSARHYCRQYHTDLANLQAVADGEDLKPITRETEAWIGLYYNASSSSTSWAGSQNDSMPRWMEVPMLSGGQCAGLRAFFSYAPRVSAMNCSSPQPFICFYGLSTSLTGAAPDPASTTRLPPPVSPGPTELCLGAPHLCSSAPQPQGVTPSDLPADSASPGSTSSVPEGVPGTPPTTAQGTALHLTVSDGTPVPRVGPGTWQVPVQGTPLDRTAYPGGTSVPGVGPGTWQVPVQGTPLHLTDLGGTPVLGVGPGTQQVSVQGTPLDRTAYPGGTPVPGGGVTRWPSAASPSLGSTGQASATSGTAAPGGSSASSWSRGAETLGGSPGQEESVAASPRSGKPAVAQRTTAPPVSTAQSQAAARESNATAVVSTEDGTDVRPTAAGTRAQRLATSAWTRTETGGKAGHAFGILKADFVVSSLKNLEMTDQFLSECTKVHVRQKSTGYLAGKPSPANMSLVYSMMPQGLLCSSHHFEAGPNIQKYFGGTTRMRVRHDSHLAPSLLCEGVWGVRRGTPHVTPSASLLSPLRMELRPTLTWKETRLKQKPG
ncbi:putative C-type lectin domain family 20 member A isoform X6 [Oryctolagus cuniculus]|uniref:putative C-type lectin domain family 20 member A isoform X6 n=1 Tax=Oryctolagus cuniculus TaxID=9986 RepID=UPI00387A0F41